MIRNCRVIGTRLARPRLPPHRRWPTTLPSPRKLSFSSMVRSLRTCAADYDGAARPVREDGNVFGLLVGPRAGDAPLEVDVFTFVTRPFRR